MSYTLTDNAYIIRDQDGAYIPPDPGNADYQEYLDWLNKGNEPNPPPTLIQSTEEKK
jgi:hypothetical protein